MSAKVSVPTGFVLLATNNSYSSAILMLNAGSNSAAVGLDLVVGIDTRTPGEKFNDFFNAAVSRATVPKGWQTYRDGQVQKFIGIGEGLNIGK